MIFEGEDETALRTKFIELSAKHHRNQNFTGVDIAKYVFRDLKEPEMRALQAATYWEKDLEVQEAILDLIAHTNMLTARAQRLQIAMDIATDTKADKRDRLIAVRLAAEMEGEIVKAVDKKVSYADVNGNRTGKVGFMFTIDADADKPPSEVLEEGEDE